MSATMGEPQHLAALEKANAIRLQRAAIRQAIRTGEISIEEAIDHPACRTMDVWEVILPLPRWGKTRAGKFFNAIAVNRHRKCGDLTARQKKLILGELELQPGKPLTVRATLPANVTTDRRDQNGHDSRAGRRSDGHRGEARGRELHFAR
jgi:hypothetical protein